jgi:hypothetical protein
MQLCAMAKNRSKSKQLPFDLTTEYLHSLWIEQDGRCCITNEVFDLSRPTKQGSCRWNAPSLDRIKPELGYTQGNVRLVCYQINTAMNEYGLEQLIYLSRRVIETVG